MSFHPTDPGHGVIGFGCLRYFGPPLSIFPLIRLDPAGSNGSDQASPPRHAQLEDLQVFGFEILNPDPNGRCAGRNGHSFLEGHLESMVSELRDDAQEALGQGRPSETARRRKN